MSDAHLTCNGQRLTALHVNVANIGPWVAELDFEAAPDVSGRVQIRAGSLVLSGTVRANLAGEYVEQWRCVVVGGAGGWSRQLGRKAYHNDAKIKARLVADDAAREVGEAIMDFVPAAERIGVDYVRSAGVASRVLEHVIGQGVPWWVGYDGNTRVGPRASVALPLESQADVLGYDPRNRMLTFSVVDPGVVQIGSVIAQSPLSEPQTVREFELYITADKTRVVAWVGGTAGERGRLAGLLEVIARRVTDAPIYGKYRYRVVFQRDDGRLELQAVRRDAGLPDLKPIRVWPGVAGAAAKLTPGTEVLVEFVEGDPQQPIVTHFAGVDGPGFVPIEIVFAESEMRAARQGDLVQSGGPGCTVVLIPVTPTTPPAPAVLPGVPHLISFSTTPPTPTIASPLYGSISTGSPKVKL